MLYNSTALDQMKLNIELYHMMFMAENFGYSALSRQDIALLRKAGLNLNRLRYKKDAVTASFNFGRLEATVRDKNKLKKLKFENYQKFVKENEKLFKTGKAEKYVIDICKQRAYTDMKKLSADAQAIFSNDLINISQEQQSKLSEILAKQKPEDHLLKRQIASKISNDLIRRVKEWQTRFDRISAYVMHMSYQHGVVHELQVQHGLYTKVWYKVQPYACSLCKKLYLLPNGQPRVFLLKTIVNNGSNIGKPRKLAKATIEPLHPNCRCAIQYYPGRDSKTVQWDIRRKMYIRKFK